MIIPLWGFSCIARAPSLTNLNHVSSDVADFQVISPKHDRTRATW
jgi:hypothetical protein